MSKNIFLDSQQYVAKLKRNSYDVSKLVNGTYKEGFLYPVYWKELSFGESIRLDLSAALRTMPMVFPIQTPIMVKFYNFAVPLRTLWKNFGEFRFNNKQFVHPYIATPRGSRFWNTGELADHMGIPTTLSRQSGNSPVRLVDIDPGTRDTFVPIFHKSVSLSSGVLFDDYFSDERSSDFPATCWRFGYPNISDEMLDSGKFFVDSSFFVSEFSASYITVILIAKFDGNSYVVAAKKCDVVLDSLLVRYQVNCNSGDISSYMSFPDAVLDSGIFGYAKSLRELLKSQGKSCDFEIVISDNYLSDVQPPHFSADLSLTPIKTDSIDLKSIIFSLSDYNQELNDVGNPFLSVEPLTSLPLRAYEAIYRSHFQDTIVEPFIIDGETQYNRYVTNLDDGADYTDYHLFRCNYEADFLTSARPSPQQGLAPLVGITSAGDITLINSEGNEYSVRVTTSDGDIIDGIDLATERGDKDMSVRRTLLDLATSGFSINALRNTNSFQRWLETNYRRSLRYRDQVFSHTGVKLSYKELDMPEFLGGFTIPLDVNTVTQMSSSVEDSPLGQLGANGGAFGRAKHNISYYAEDECIFMTLMCIRPIPVYSQILSRDWLKSTPVDYYNPEFGKIGNQPITYEEVCPVQAYNEGVEITDVFGYQRPWYWRISAVDEVHGLFRTTMSSFLQQRVFGSTPKLSADFLHINQEKMTDVFVITDEDKSDPFYGQIGIKAFFKSATPRKNVPSIE